MVDALVSVSAIRKISPRKEKAARELGNALVERAQAISRLKQAQDRVAEARAEWEQVCAAED